MPCISIGSLYVDSNSFLPTIFVTPRIELWPLWKFENTACVRQPILQQFHSESVVNSSSLTGWLCEKLDLPDSVKVAYNSAGVRKISSQPLAHDQAHSEEELHRTTGVSLLRILWRIDLASYTGIHYDQMLFIWSGNAVMAELLKENRWIRLLNYRRWLIRSQQIVFFGGTGFYESNIQIFEAQTGVYSVQVGRHLTAEQLVLPCHV